MSTRRVLHALAVIAAMATLAAGPALATVYRWTDAEGKVHYGEEVPAAFRKTARPVTTDVARPSADQVREAQERAAKEKALAASATARTQPAPIAPPREPVPPVPRKRPDRLPDESTDCATWARLYQESLECFGPFRTGRGGVKPEAFAQCNAVQEPPSRCRQVLP